MCKLYISISLSRDRVAFAAWNFGEVSVCKSICGFRRSICLLFADTSGVHI